MKAISIHQPWASWIAMGWKTIETRTHSRFKNLVGERIAIHAAKKWDKKAIPKIAYPYLIKRWLWRFYNELDNARGEVLCTAYASAFGYLDKESYSDNALCDCSEGLYGLFLKDIKVLKTPLPWKGRQGIFHIPEELIK